MNTTLLVAISGNTYERLDLFEDIPITLTIQQSDLTNLNGRRAPYSKTIQLPDSAQNSLVLEHYYEVNGLDFNPLNKVPCVVQYRGTDIFTGVLRLNAVTESQGQRLWEVFILGEVSDFASQFRDLELQDLSWVDLQHELSYSAITTSWEYSGTTGGLFDGAVIYPLINYGLDYQGDSESGATPTFTYTFGQTRSFDQPGFGVPPQIFKPAVQVKTILNKIFEETEYEVVSDFFDTDYFKSIYVDTFQNGQLGITSASAVTNQNIFKVYTNGANTINPIFQQTGSLQFLPINWRTFSPDGYDPLNNFTLGNTLQVAPLNEGYFRVPYAGDYFFNIRFNYFDPNVALGNSFFYIIANKNSDLNQISVGSSFYTSARLQCPTDGSEGAADLYFSGSCVAGEYIKIFILLDPASNFGTQVALKGFSSGGVTTAFPMWDLYTSPTLTQDIVDLSLGVPNINCFTFFKSMITMFNLVVIQDEVEKQIRIEPYNWYYNDTEREQKDWTNILDQNSEKRIEPLSFDLSKEIVWTYQNTDFEYLPKLFYDRFDYVYGRKRYTTGNDIFVGEQIYDVPFGSCPTSGVTGAPNFIIPQFYYLNNQQQAPYATKPHLFFWVGNRLAYKDSLRSVSGSWYLLSGASPVEWTTYPCVSHLSTLESDFPSVISDLNFNPTFDFFGNDTNLIEQFTPFNLYQTFWETYVENLYSYETRRLTGNFYFTPLDVYETSLKDKVWIKDANYTIEKITDANLVNKGMVKISLIKNTFPYYKITPPPPVYVYPPNEPYPTPEPAFISLCFVSTDQNAVCNGSAPLENVLSFGTGGVLQNLEKVYYDTGTSYAIYPVGTYIRQTTSTTTFVVIDNYGRILQTPC